MYRSHGILHWVFPTIIVLGGYIVLISGRDLSMLMVGLESVAEHVRPPAMVWAQRGVTVLVLVASAERIVTHFAHHETLGSPSLLLGFLAFWLGSVAAPAVYGSHPTVSYEYTYSLVLGVALIMARPVDGLKTIERSRDALFVFMLAGLLLIPFNPKLVMDATYGQGLIPGLPRFAGLAAHSVTMGTMVATALVCLWHRPYRRTWLNRLAWLTGLTVLFLAQSKTGWVAFVLSTGAILIVRHAAPFWRRLGDARNNSFGVLVCAGFMLLVAVVTAILALGLVQEQVSDFLGSAQGAQLTTLTGRDQIWGVAMEEWHQSWWFGYGPTLWDEIFRASIGMPNATHGHNQMMDTLARSGTVGGASLVVYAAVLLVLSVRYAPSTRGLSLALFLTLALYSISEVPMLLFGYGSEVLTHLLLVVTLASAAAARQPLEARMPQRLKTAS